MKYAIIGSGNVGSAVGSAVAKLGHEVTFVARDKNEAERLAQKLGAHATDSVADAVGDAEVVVLAVPFASVDEVLAEAGKALDGRIVIDVTNPLTDDYSGLVTGEESAAELIQQRAPGAKVVKAFNTVFASKQAEAVVDDTPLDGLYAGDDEGAKQTVAELLESIGYRPIDAGPLAHARHLESLGFLNIHLNATNGWPWQSAWKLIGPTG